MLKFKHTNLPLFSQVNYLTDKRGLSIIKGAKEYIFLHEFTQKKEESGVLMRGRKVDPGIRGARQNNL